MKKLFVLSLLTVGVLQLGGAALAATLFGPSDTVIGIDTDFASDYPSGESPLNVTDQTTNTKYLNFGAADTGLIVTPGGGASTIKSLQLTTANDAPERDPLTFDLYGTNDPITSPDNSLGDGETYTLIASGVSGLLDLEDGTTERNTLGVVQDFGANTTSYSSYKVIFPTLRDEGAANSMQIADLALFTDVGGGGSQILSGIFGGDAAIGVTDNASKSLSNYPGGENPSLVFDNDPGTKYLNFSDTNSGLIVTRADGLPTIVESLTFTTGNDAPGRDPLQFDLYGTNDPIVSPDNSRGIGETWTLITGGASTGLEDFFDMGDGDEMRGATGAAQPVANNTSYSAYRLVFPELRGGVNEGIMQVADVLFEGTVVPEPSTLLLALCGLALLGRRGK